MLKSLDLGVEKLDNFFNEGLYIEKSALGDEEISSIINDIIQLCSTKRDPLQDKPIFTDSRNFLTNEMDLFIMENFIEMAPSVSSLVNDRKLLSVLGELGNGRPILFEDKVVFKKSGASAVGAHQDAVWFGWEAYADSFITVLVALEDCTVENACLEFSFGNHKNGRLGDLYRKDLPEHFKYVPVPLQKGDIIIYNSYLPHRSAMNSSPESRMILNLSYHFSEAENLREKYYYFKPRLQRYFMKNRLKEKFFKNMNSDADK